MRTPHRGSRLAPVLLAALFAAPARADQIVVTVPGTANPWLAGLPKGATANAWEGVVDRAPAESPVPVGLAVGSGSVLLFGAVGGTSNGPTHPLVGPDGAPAFSNHVTGAEHGIAAARVPLSSLVGLFLGPTAP